MTQTVEAIKDLPDSDVKKNNDKDSSDLSLSCSLENSKRYILSVYKSAYFHALYGALDGLSVSYSTVKYLCDVAASSSDEYQQNITQALTSPEFIPLLFLEGLIVTGFSLLANHANSLDKDKQSTYQKHIQTIWLYMRDVLKGAKNGYKGTKGLMGIMNQLEVVAKQDVRALVLPIGIIIGAVCLINRCWNRAMNDARKALKDEHKKVVRSLQSYNQQLQKEQELHNSLIGLNQLVREIESLQLEIEGLRSSNPDLTDLESQLKTKEAELTDLLIAPETRYLELEIAELERRINASPSKNNTLLKKTLKEKQTRLDAIKREEPTDLPFSLKEIKAKIAIRQNQLDALIYNREKQDYLALAKALIDTHEGKPSYLEESNLRLYKSLNAKDKENLYSSLQDQYKKYQDLLKKEDSDKKEKELSKITTAIQLLIRKKAFDYTEATRKQAFKKLEATENALEQNHQQNKYKLLVSNAIAGIVDAPYLYTGVMGLAVLSGPIIVAMSIILISFVIISVMARVHEEEEKQKDARKQVLEGRLVKQANALIEAQNTFYLFRVNNPHATKEELDKAFQQVIPIFNQWHATREEIKELVEPSYYHGLMMGIKDGLSLFGAISSIYYAVNIILLLAGTAFPPALIIAVVFVGLAAVIGFCAFRLYDTYQKKQEFTDKFELEKAHEEAEYDPHAELLGLNDWNSDGITKGEFYFQEMHEIVRASCAGMGKSDNLVDFTLTGLKEQQEDGSYNEPLPMVIFSFLLAGFYGAVLGIRAIGKGFSPKGNKDSKPQEGVKERFESDQPPSSCSGHDQAHEPETPEKPSSRKTSQAAAARMFGIFSIQKPTTTPVQPPSKSAITIS